MTTKLSGISVIICTRNRSLQLQDCLESLLPQLEEYENSELVLVDNGDEPGNLGVLKWSKNANVRYCAERRIGLSYARNTGMAEARYDWLCFLDDDTRVLPGFLLRIHWTASHQGFDCFGGTYQAWFKYGKPNWVPAKFGTKEFISRDIKRLSGPELSGGIFIIKRSILLGLGGFDCRLGMAKNVGFGEETELQLRLLRDGYVVGFDPDLIVDHCVMPHKLKLSWHLKFFVAKGRDNQLVYRKSNVWKHSLALIKTIALLGVVKIPLSIYWFFRRRDFYWQNMVLYTLEPILLWLGGFRAIWLNEENNDKRRTPIEMNV